MLPRVSSICLMAGIVSMVTATILRRLDDALSEYAVWAGARAWGASDVAWVMRHDIIDSLTLGGALFIVAAVLGFLAARRIRGTWARRPIVLGIKVLCVVVSAKMAGALPAVVYASTAFSPYQPQTAALLMGLDEYHRISNLLFWGVLLPGGIVTLWAQFRHMRTAAKGTHCKECGYDLTANVSGVCPECGEAI